MPTPFVVNAHSKEEKKDCVWFLPNNHVVI